MLWLIVPRITLFRSEKDYENYEALVLERKLQSRRESCLTPQFETATADQRVVAL